MTLSCKFNSEPSAIYTKRLDFGTNCRVHFYVHIPNWPIQFPILLIMGQTHSDYKKNLLIKSYMFYLGCSLQFSKALLTYKIHKKCTRVPELNFWRQNVEKQKFISFGWHFRYWLSNFSLFQGGLNALNNNFQILKWVSWGHLDIK